MGRARGSRVRRRHGSPVVDGAAGARESAAERALLPAPHCHSQPTPVLWGGPSEARRGRLRSSSVDELQRAGIWQRGDLQPVDGGPRRPDSVCRTRHNLESPFQALGVCFSETRRKRRATAILWQFLADSTAIPSRYNPRNRSPLYGLGGFCGVSII